MTISPAVIAGGSIVTAAEIRALEHLGVVDFSTTINLGAIVLGLLILVVAGAFTVRSNVAKVWREQAEGWQARAKELETELAQQRELKHEAVTELAAERKLRDLTPVMASLAAQTQALGEIAATLAEVKTALLAMNGRS